MSAPCNCTVTWPAVHADEHAADCPDARPSEAAHDSDSAPRAPHVGVAPVVGGLGAGERIDRVAGAIWVAGLHADEQPHGPSMWAGMLAAIEGPDAERCYRDGGHCGDCTDQPQTCERCVVEDAREQARAALVAMGECASCADAARVIEALLATRGATNGADEPCEHGEGVGCPTCGRGRPTRGTCGLCEDAAIGAAFALLDKLRGTP